VYIEGNMSQFVKVPEMRLLYTALVISAMQEACTVRHSRSVPSLKLTLYCSVWR